MSILQLPQNKQIKVLSAPQKALCMTISNSQEIITTIEKELITKAVIPEYGNDAVSYKHLLNISHFKICLFIINL